MGKILKLGELIEGYRLFFRAEGRSPKSIRWYMHKLRIFEGYLRSQGFPLEVSKITTDHLREFLVYLRESVKADELNPHKPAANRPLSPHTIRGYAQVLKAFFSWATHEGLRETNPAKRLASPKVPQTAVPTFSEAQVRGFLSVVNRKSPIGFRDYCIILTLLDTGIRLSELHGTDGEPDRHRRCHHPPHRLPGWLYLRPRGAQPLAHPLRPHGHSRCVALPHG